MTQFASPPGRLVWGDPFALEVVKDDATGQPKKNKDGSDMTECSIGVAFAKNDPQWPAFYQLLKTADRTAWPQFHDAAGNILPGVKFADKITDGDGFNTKGQKRAKPGNGYEGCWIVKFGGGFLPQVKRHDGRAWVDAAPGSIKRGDYVMVSGSTSSNNSTQSPGMYRNLNMVGFVGFGEAIVTGPDAEEVFGAAAPVLPPGASATPLAAPGLPGAPAAPQLTPSPATLYPMPTGGPAPVAPSAPPPPPAAPVAPPPPAVPTLPDGRPYTMTGPHTREALVALGWTDAQMIEQGHMRV